ncbi:hypothetical protein ACFQT0_05540 [Hymenobacter humi]|uniref:Uncharacterized protein n=1 Tax=Hymenobacter humi TaxID=1411620 RepID=A0ABW2U390_9BACT
MGHRILGYPVGRLQPDATDEAAVTALVARARQRGFRLLYWSAAPTDAPAAATAQALGAHLADHKVTFAMPVPAGPSTLPPGVAPTTELTPRCSRWHCRPATSPATRRTPALRPMYTNGCTRAGLKTR